MKIELNKEYTTRDGNEVRVYAVDGGGKYPVHGAYLMGEEWRTETWTKEGRFSIKVRESSMDLIEKESNLDKAKRIYAGDPVVRCLIDGEISEIDSSSIVEHIKGRLCAFNKDRRFSTVLHVERSNEWAEIIDQDTEGMFAKIQEAYKHTVSQHIDEVPMDEIVTYIDLRNALNKLIRKVNTL